MDLTISSLISNKIFIAIAILLASIVIYSILKRLIKIIVIILIALIIYIGYMNYKGEKTEIILQNYLIKGEKELKKIQQKHESLGNKAD